ncbi:DUF3768 domain-containing protein [Rhodopseudomonas sp. P2A-2r]|uniref:DUF3768 domain-containing protein n=1 Tax=Rhodopseudomonas sp. P2A-2r TaxID=2991972 RepID=UPI0022348AE0|nr:DUF3768 domain-containing protein [Rhodopseudomonas sp. P2A-2r]UZE49815.1 DUF3768 domain-containing protein [Rhodopseudomonas sp. P2A-2r]
MQLVDVAAPQGSKAGDPRAAKVRALNDAFRERLPRPTKGCRLIVTDGLGSLTIEQFADLLQAVSTYSDFGPDNDPHGEHDFGAIEQDGVRYFWKTEYFDQWMQFASPDPSDPAVTTRVMTIMLASEY